jgi:hypothetical protein
MSKEINKDQQNDHEKTAEVLASKLGRQKQKKEKKKKLSDALRKNLLRRKES